MSEKVKILIVRFSSIGDIVLTTPVIRCLKEQLHGESEIHFITFKKYASLLEHNPYVDQIHAVDKVSNAVLEELKAIDFQYIIDLHHNFRSMRLKSRLKVTSFSFNKLNPLKWILVNFKVNKLPSLHIVDRYLETTKALGIENDGKGLDYFLPPNIEQPQLPQGFSSYTALALSANHNTKKPTDDHYLKLVKEVKSPMVIIGGPAEKELGEQLETTDSAKIVNMAGKCSLHESALLIKNSMQVITPDTGMMHIAAAFEKRILSIWGNTVPEFGMYPYLTGKKEELSEIFEVNGLSCRPCSKIGFDKCPKGHFKCMEDQDWKEIVKRANSSKSLDSRIIH